MDKFALSTRTQIAVSKMVIFDENFVSQVAGTSYMDDTG